MNNYYEYYSRQAKGYGMPIYIGGRSSQGHGLGNFLSGIARAVVPILKRGGKSLLKESIRTGASILQDVSQGGNLKSSLNKRMKEGGTRLIYQATDELVKPPARRNKRKVAGIKSQSSGKRRKTSNKQKDIFDN